nr:reverse transcriptase domain-containing protein [Tanacetum cinerariifolium]
MPPPFINLEEDERVEETLTDLKLSKFTIKVPPPLIQKPKPPSQRNYVVHQRDPLYLNIPYPSRMHKQKQQEKDEVQIHKFLQMFKQLHIYITLADALILILKYPKMLKALLYNKEKLLELANTPLNENYSAVILKKLPEKLGDPGKFLNPCGFSELKCKALADLGASINLIPLSVWKKLVTFLVDFVIVDYESDPRVLLILGRPFLRTARALINVHREVMILRDGDERLTLNMRHETSSYSSQPQKESIDMINIYNDSSEDFLKDLFATNHLSGNPTFSSHTNLTSPKGKDDIFDPKGDIVLVEKLINLDSTKDLPPPHNIDPLSGSTTSSSHDHLLKESSDFLPSPEYDLFLFEDFYEVDAFPSTNNEDKVFNLGILIQENLSESNVQATPDKNVKKIAISHAFIIFKDFDPPLYELPFHKEVLGSQTLLSFLSENREKVFKPEILTSKGVHSSLLPELSHWGPKAFKVIKIFESPMEIFPALLERTSVFWMLRVSISNPHEQINGGIRISWILKTHARRFVLRSPDLHILSFILGIQYTNLID